MIVLLDIDGVLNRQSEWKIPYMLDQDCLDNLKAAVHGINPYIVLISSWRKGFVSAGNTENTPQIKKLEKELSKRGLHIDEKAPDRINDRDYLIKRYGENVLVLDDDPAEYKEKHNGLYLVDCKTGLTDADVKKIRKLISRM